MADYTIALESLHVLNMRDKSGDQDSVVFSVTVDNDLVGMLTGFLFFGNADSVHSGETRAFANFPPKESDKWEISFHVDDTRDPNVRTKVWVTNMRNVDSTKLEAALFKIAAASVGLALKGAAAVGAIVVGELGGFLIEGLSAPTCHGMSYMLDEIPRASKLRTDTDGEPEESTSQPDVFTRTHRRTERGDKIDDNQQGCGDPPVAELTFTVTRTDRKSLIRPTPDPRFRVKGESEAPDWFGLWGEAAVINLCRVVCNITPTGFLADAITVDATEHLLAPTGKVLVSAHRNGLARHTFGLPPYHKDHFPHSPMFQPPSDLQPPGEVATDTLEVGPPSNVVLQLYDQIDEQNRFVLRRLRYFRADVQGNILTDVMLRPAAEPPR